MRKQRFGMLIITQVRANLRVGYMSECVIEVEVEATHIPEEFEVSIEGAEAGTQITAADVKLPAGATLISDPETLLVNVIEAPTETDLESDEEEAPEGEAAEDAAQEAEEA